MFTAQPRHELIDGLEIPIVRDLIDQAFYLVNVACGMFVALGPPLAQGIINESAAQETPCTWRRPLCGTWEILLVPGLRSGPVQEGESPTLIMHAGEKSGLGHSTEEATEQREATPGGGRGGKGLAQGERPSLGHGPGTEPGSRVAPNGDRASDAERVQTVHRLGV